LDHGDASGVAIMLFWIGLLPAVPAIAVVAAGALLDNDLLRWAGIPVGIATGVFLAWWLGRIAYRRLQTRGPEMLYLLRARKPSRAKTGQAQPSVVDAMSRKQRIIFTLCVSLGWLPLFPQGLAPLGIKLAGAHETRVWFLALYLPEAWQWPTIAFMIALGLLTYGVAVRLYWAHNTHRRLASASPQDSARA